MLPRRRFARPARVTTLIVVTALSLSMTAVAVAGGDVRCRRSVPTMADQITNLDVLRQQIRNYYGDPLGTRGFAPDGNYAQEAGRSAAPVAVGWPPGPPRRAGPEGHRPRRRRHHAGHVELRDLQQLGVQPDDERQFVTEQSSRRCPAWSRWSHCRPEGYAIFCLTGRRRPGSGHSGQSGERRHRCRRRLPGADHAERR